MSHDLAGAMERIRDMACDWHGKQAGPIFAAIASEAIRALASHREGVWEALEYPLSALRQATENGARYVVNELRGALAVGAGEKFFSRDPEDIVRAAVASPFKPHPTPAAPATVDGVGGMAHYPSECPITGRPFFMVLERDGRLIPTYGGPFDSYTIPVRDDDGELSVERYDHDAGSWVDGGESLCLRVVRDDVEVTSPAPDRATLERCARQAYRCGYSACGAGLDVTTRIDGDISDIMAREQARAVAAATRGQA